MSDDSSSVLRPPPTVSRLFALHRAPPPPSSSAIFSPSSMDDTVTGESGHRPSSTVQTLHTLGRQSAQLQQNVQALLDAQQEALRKYAVGEAGETDSIASGGRSPSLSSTGGVVPVRQPDNQPLSLRDARRGLSRAMRNLSVVKARETQALQQARSQTEQTITKIDGWTQKQVALDGEIETLQAQGSNNNPLAKEERSLADQISALEAQLAQLYDQHRAVRARRQREVNAAEAQLSSWRESRRLVETQVDAFLRRPPPDVKAGALSTARPGSPSGRKAQQASPSSAAQDESVWDLPAKRRTLALAKEWYEGQLDAYGAAKRNTDTERQALENGGELWQQTLSAITRFERLLAHEMKAVAGITAGSDQQGSEADGMLGVLGHLDRTLDIVGANFALAERRRWNLLVCCIGAELEALRQGRGILRSAMGLPAIEDENTSNPVAGDREADDLIGGEHVRHSQQEIAVERIESGSESHSPAVERRFSRPRPAGHTDGKTSEGAQTRPPPRISRTSSYRSEDPGDLILDGHDGDDHESD